MDKWLGKNAVVTGASAGIGAAIAVSLAKAGVNVIGLARRKDQVEALADQIKGAKGKIQALVCDVSDPKSVDVAFEWIEKNIGTVNIWINNAGIWRYNKLTSDELKDKEIIDTINTNFTGLVLCSRKAVKLMEKNGEPGYIINVNSIAGQTTAFAMRAEYGMMAECGTNVYSSSKHAVTNVTEVLRLELALKPNNAIRVSVSINTTLMLSFLLNL